jgi:hypothetical protein
VSLFELPPLEPGYLSTDPPPSPDVRRTRTNADLLAQGTHPATRAPVLDRAWGYSCGDCAHAERVTNGRRAYWKCELHRLGMSFSAASDIRVSWPACTLLRLEAL